jgi:hypothetical protein
MSLSRHRKEHLPELLARAYDADEQATADGLLADIERIRESAFELLDQAERSHVWKARVAAIGECRENVRILGELYGKLEASRVNVQVNVLASPQWLALKGQIVEALCEHPEALEAVQLAITNGGSGAN